MRALQSPETPSPPEQKSRQVRAGAGSTGQCLAQGVAPLCHLSPSAATQDPELGSHLLDLLHQWMQRDLAMWTRPMMYEAPGMVLGQAKG